MSSFSSLLTNPDLKDARIAAAAGASALLLILNVWRRNTPPKVEEEKYQGGEAYGDPPKVVTGLLQDVTAMKSPKQALDAIKTLFEVVKSHGKPLDDKKMVMERLMALVASLPETSAKRLELTQTIIDTLWDSMQHPPLTYMGDKFQYRQADGSYNNVLEPDLGKAGTPYAKTVRPDKRMLGCQPDAGLLFDMLMAREDGHFKQNPAGISSMLFYHATVIIHDIFRTNRADPNISDTSSYLDLAPLYGSSIEDQMKVRTGSKGLLHPDTFHEERLIGQPPGVNVFLVMYNRFHNYVADILLKINEKNRFPQPPEGCSPETKMRIEKKLDEDLFQTARLIVAGLYVNITLHDYLRGLTNTHHSESTWTLDPRIAIEKHFDEEGAPRGIGNQVSAEFNLLYRFHSIISQRDEKWLNDFLKTEVFPNLGKDLNELTAKELVEGLILFESKIDKDPKKRTFGGLTRDPTTGRFDDGAMAKILKESIEDPAGLFGARMVPKALRVVEILGILQARKWQLASLNEFRDFFGLKRHATMEEINPDPQIANTLRSLYNHPDMVELYPGLFLEDAKPVMNPGMGACPPYSVGRAVLSDAVSLIRSDRFSTIDYTPSTLTNWGMEEVQQDYKTLGGSVLYKLIQRALPNWFPYNSLYVMQPMYTPTANKAIAEEFGTIDQYVDKGPAAPRPLTLIVSHAITTQVLKNKYAFAVPWLQNLNDMFPKKRDYSDYMLSGDKDINFAQRALVEKELYKPKNFQRMLFDAVVSQATALLQKETFQYTDGIRPQQIDILRDVAIPVNVRVLNDIFLLDLKTQENPKGSLNVADLYKHLLNVRIWGFNNNDPGMAWRRRAWAREGATVLTDTTRVTVQSVAGESRASTLAGLLFGSRTARPDWSKPGTLRGAGREMVTALLRAGKTVEQVADINWLTALAGVGVVVNVFAEVLAWFLDPKNAEHWAKMQDFAAASTAGATQVARDDADANIRAYVLEAQRLTSSQRDLRITRTKTTVQIPTGTQINGKMYGPGSTYDFQPGEIAVLLFGYAGKDPAVAPNPEAFRPGRPRAAYLHFGDGPHQCLGREIALTYVSALVRVCAGLKNLRRAPGAMGLCKSIEVTTGDRAYLNDNWSYLTFDPTTWKLHYDGTGKGVNMKDTTRPDPEWDLGLIKIAMAEKYFKKPKA